MLDGAALPTIRETITCESVCSRLLGNDESWLPSHHRMLGIWVRLCVLRVERSNYLRWVMRFADRIRHKVNGPVFGCIVAVKTAKPFHAYITTLTENLYGGQSFRLMLRVNDFAMSSHNLKSFQGARGGRQTIGMLSVYWLECIIETKICAQLDGNQSYETAESLKCFLVRHAGDEGRTEFMDTFQLKWLFVNAIVKLLRCNLLRHANDVLAYSMKWKYISLLFFVIIFEVNIFLRNKMNRYVVLLCVERSCTTL